MSENKLQRRTPSAFHEKGQYALAIIVIASMLIVTEIPVFVVFFFGIFAYFIIRMFTSGTRNETREIFEFYLSANEILRHDDRRWYGFEVQEAIDRGEDIIRRMSAAPPLVRFALGALYNKSGDHKSAVSHLANVLEHHGGDESAIAYPTPELRNYVKILRKIERDPADAPLTSAAVRALERARKVRGKAMLEESRTAFATGVPVRAEISGEIAAVSGEFYVEEEPQPASFRTTSDSGSHAKTSERGSKNGSEDAFANRKPIAEVLYDIYDRKAS